MLVIHADRGDIHNLCVCKCEYGLFVVHTERLKF